MAGYAPNHRKQHKLVQKRERELLHAMSSGASAEKLSQAVENLRHAKLQTLKSHFAHKSVLPPSHYVPTKTAQLWQSLTQEQIVARYVGKKISRD
jgi:hypothetical protein